MDRRLLIRSVALLVGLTVAVDQLSSDEPAVRAAGPWPTPTPCRPPGFDWRAAGVRNLDAEAAGRPV